MKIFKLGDKNSKEALIVAAKSIKNGGVVVSPTDTVYGLVCNAADKKTVEKIFRIKERSKDKPLPLFIKDIEAAKELVFINEKQEKFLKKVWPGQVTAILFRKPKTAKLYGVNEETMALRIPGYQPLNDLLEKLNIPLAETSVNVSGEPPLNEISKIIEHFNKRKIQPDLIIDAGNLEFSKPSTVIDLTGEKPKILRK